MERIIYLVKILPAPKCNVSLEELTPRMFSFNSPFGACKKCEGIGTHMEVNPDLVVPDKNKSLVQGAIASLGSNLGGIGMVAF